MEISSTVTCVHSRFILFETIRPRGSGLQGFATTLLSSVPETFPSFSPRIYNIRDYCPREGGGKGIDFSIRKIADNTNAFSSLLWHVYETNNSRDSIRLYICIYRSRDPFLTDKRLEDIHYARTRFAFVIFSRRIWREEFFRCARPSCTDNGFKRNDVSFLEIKNFRESKREKKTRLETNEGFFILEDNRCFVENGGGHSSLLFPPIGDTIPRYMSWKEVSMAEQTPYNITVKHPLPVHRGTCTSIKSWRHPIHTIVSLHYRATICIRLDEKIASITRIRTHDSAWPRWRRTFYR